VTSRSQVRRRNYYNTMPHFHHKTSGNGNRSNNGISQKKVWKDITLGVECI